MAFLESGWIRAIRRGDSRTFLDLARKGIMNQFKLNGGSAKEAARYLHKAWTSNREAELRDRYLRYHGVLSARSGLGFDPNLATEQLVKMLQDGISADNLSSYYSTIYRGVSEDSLRPAMEIRTDAFDRLNGLTEDSLPEEIWQGWRSFGDSLIRSYDLLDKALKN